MRTFEQVHPYKVISAEGCAYFSNLYTAAHSAAIRRASLLEGPNVKITDRGEMQMIWENRPPAAKW